MKKKVNMNFGSPVFFTVLFFLISFLPLPLNGQTDGRKLLEDVKRNFEQVKDYRADMDIRVDINMIKVPDTKVKLLFKAPDKMRIVSDNFAMLPKEGLNFSPSTILKGDNSIIFEKEEIHAGTRIGIVKVIPLGGASDIVLSTVKVDMERLLILQVESTTRTKGTFVIDMDYNKSLTPFPLPSKMSFKFDMSRQSVMQGFGNDQPPKKENEKKNKRKPSEGTIKITYSGYVVNKGIPDSEFIEKEEKK